MKYIKFLIYYLRGINRYLISVRNSFIKKYIRQLSYKTMSKDKCRQIILLLYILKIPKVVKD